MLVAISSVSKYVLFNVVAEAMCSCLFATIMRTVEVCADAPDRMTASIDLFWRVAGASILTKN